MKKLPYILAAILLLAYVIADFVLTGNYYPMCIALIWSVLFLAFLGYKKYGAHE